ncbi:hypothetical protein ABRP29_20090 [Pseudomonas sp. WHRI 8822A]|uniref:hypothetical protein n=1 Tax=Pseudomonas sp. WHRI 8822A TaxID=3162568 RepID=UPI0032EFB0D5
MFNRIKQAVMRDGQQVESSASVGKALGGKSLALITAGAASLTAGSANAAITVPPELLEVFVDLAVAFGTLMAAGAVLFGVIRGGVALFKIAGRVFSAAGA